MKKELKLSVCVVTYNQENYIAECLQSLVGQKTNFKFEIIVSDDCSTDNTRNIILDFSKRYPDIFRIFLHENNMGALKNFKFIHGRANGKYIAHMDGDDYALPKKLQTQVDFLDANPNCNIVFHRVDYIDNGEYIKGSVLTDRVLEYKFYRPDIIKYISIGPNTSKMYRAEIRSVEFPNFDLVDYTVNVIGIGSGYASYCSKESLGVYRRGIGISGSTTVNTIVYESLKYFTHRYPDCKKEINISSWTWFFSSLKHGRKSKWKFFKVALYTFSISGFLSYFLSRSFRRELSGL